MPVQPSWTGSRSNNHAPTCGNMDRTLIRRALLRILRNRPGEAMLIGMAIATLAIIAFLKPTRESEFQSTSRNAQLATQYSEHDAPEIPPFTYCVEHLTSMDRYPSYSFAQT